MTRRLALRLDRRDKLLTAAMGGGANVSYLYDPLGRRVQKDVNGTITEYLHDGTHVIAEYDGSGSVLRRYIHGPGTDRPIAMVEGAAHSYYHADRLGSVVALTDDSGAPVTHYTYDAYGIPYLVDRFTGAQTQVAAGQPYLFTGRRFDFETGLYYYRARYYSASLGRFLQTDPIGYEDQMNLYAYVGNDPVNGADPSGLGSCPDGGVLPGASTVKCEDGPAADGGRTPKAKKGAAEDPGSPDVIKEQRRQAIERGKAYIEDSPVDVKAEEDGYYEIYNIKTGERKVFCGSIPGSCEGSSGKAGYPASKRGADVKEFNFEFQKQYMNGEWILLVTAHSHPANQEEWMNNIQDNLSDDDRQNLLAFGPVVLKTPGSRSKRSRIIVKTRRRYRPFSDYLKRDEWK